MTVWGKMLGKIQSLAKFGSRDEICQYETPGGPTGQLVSFFLSFSEQVGFFWNICEFNARLPLY